MAKVKAESVSRARALTALRLVYRVTNMTEKDFLASVNMIKEKFPSERESITIPIKL